MGGGDDIPMAHPVVVQDVGGGSSGTSDVDEVRAKAVQAEQQGNFGEALALYERVVEIMIKTGAPGNDVSLVVDHCEQLRLKVDAVNRGDLTSNNVASKKVVAGAGAAGVIAGSVVGGMVGLSVLGGVAGGVAAASMAATDSSANGDRARQVGQAGAKLYDKAIEVNEQHDISGRVSNTARGIGQRAQEFNKEHNIVERVSEDAKNAYRKAVELDQKHDISGKTVDVAKKSLNVLTEVATEVGKADQKYGVSKKIGEMASTGIKKLEESLQPKK